MGKELQNIKQTGKNGIFHVIKRDFFSIPISVRIISFSLFVFIFGWSLGADIFFSVYIKFIIDNVFWIAIIGSILSISKLFFSLPIGAINDHSDMKSIISLSKLFYVMAGFLYFFAGIFHSVFILIIAVILNGFANAALFVTYQTYIREHSQKNNRCTVFGLFFSSINISYVIGAFIAAILINRIYLPYLFLFIVLFTLISLLTDSRLPNLSKKKLKELFGKETFLHQFFREVFSISAVKNTIISIKGYPHKLYTALGFEFVFNVLNYVGFLFIPIVALANNLSLSQIAILFGIMRIPYVINFFTAEIADKYDKKTIIWVVMIFLSFLFALLGRNEEFGAFVIISLGISIGLSMIRPIISGLISDCTPPRAGGNVTGAGEFTGRLGEIFGALIFGFLSLIIGLKFSFVAIGIIIFVVSVYQLIKILSKKPTVHQGDLEL